MKDDFTELENKVYSGRGIIVGMTPNGYPFMAYTLTGRSPSSKARELVLGKNEKTGETTNTIRTSVTDKEQLEKGSPALLLYPAFAYKDSVLVGSNGAQTKLLFSAIGNLPKDFRRGDNETSRIMDYAFNKPHFEYDQKDDKWIDITTFEPDAPNDTPRINGVINSSSAVLSIIRNGLNGKESDTHSYLLFKGINYGAGVGITTYAGGNENPLEPFRGKPFNVSIGNNSAQTICENIFQAISHGEKPEENYAVGAAVSIMNSNGGLDQHIINATTHKPQQSIIVSQRNGIN